MKYIKYIIYFQTISTILDKVFNVCNAYDINMF